MKDHMTCKDPFVMFLTHKPPKRTMLNEFPIAVSQNFKENFENQTELICDNTWQFRKIPSTPICLPIISAVKIFSGQLFLLVLYLVLARKADQEKIFQADK